MNPLPSDIRLHGSEKWHNFDKFYQIKHIVAWMTANQQKLW